MSFLFTFTTPWADSVDEKLAVFSQKIGNDITDKLSPEETICMKCQPISRKKNTKNVSTCRLLKYSPVC